MLPINLISTFCNPGKVGQWLASIVVSACGISAGIAFSWPSSALPKIRSGEIGFTLNLWEQSWVSSIIFLGNLLSPIPCGYFMQKIGRRNVLFCSIWLQVASWLMIYNVEGVELLCVARVLSGAWTGVVYTVVPVYIGECVDPRLRGTMGSFFSICLYSGSLIQSLLGATVSYHTIALVSTYFNIVLGALLCIIPESPYHYLSKGKTKSAEDSLKWLRGYTDATVLLSIEDSVIKQLKNKTSFRDLLATKASRKALLIVESLGAVQRTSGLTILLAFSSLAIPDSWVQAQDSLIILNIVWIASSLIISPFIDLIGRRILLLTSCIGSSLVMLLVSVWYFLRDSIQMDLSSVNYLPLLLFILHGITYSMGIVSIPNIIQGELFPLRIKGKASGITSMVVALFSGIATQIFLPIQDSVGIFLNFFICCISSLIGALITKFLLFETKGKTLEEIQNILSGGEKRKMSQVSRY